MKYLMILGAVLFAFGCSNMDEEDISPAVELMETEYSESLIFMREEEKLARDVYQSLFAIWAKPIFTNIASSEQQHMDAVKGLLDQYGLEDPVIDNTIGAFENEELQGLYIELMDEGSQSIEKAYAVGALIEEIDIRDLDLAIDSIAQADIITVYESLNKGSRNHLRSFYKTLNQIGVVYQPQILDAEYFDAIVNSAMETGK